MYLCIFFSAPPGSSFLFFLLGRMKANSISGVYVTLLLLAHLCLGSDRRNKVNYAVDNGVQIRFNYNILFMYFLPKKKKSLKSTSFNVVRKKTFLYNLKNCIFFNPSILLKQPKYKSLLYARFVVSFSFVVSGIFIMP